MSANSIPVQVSMVPFWAGIPRCREIGIGLGKLELRWISLALHELVRVLTLDAGNSAHAISSYLCQSCRAANSNFPGNHSGHRTFIFICLIHVLRQDIQRVCYAYASIEVALAFMHGKWGFLHPCHRPGCFFPSAQASRSIQASLFLLPSLPSSPRAFQTKIYMGHSAPKTQDRLHFDSHPTVLFSLG